MTTAGQLGRLRFDTESFVLYDGTEVVPLAPRPARMLAELVRAGGAVVPASSMRDALWGGARLEGRNLNQQMYMLRRTLQREPRLTIQNIPRRGYRLVITPERTQQAPQSPRFAWSGVAAGAAAISLALVVSMSHNRAVATAFDRDASIANYLATSEGPHHLSRAAGYFRDMIRRAPNRGGGYGGLAVVEAQEALGLAGAARERAFSLARTSAAQALRRDAKESNALTALGIVASVDERHNDVAQRLFDSAVAADPTAEGPRAWRAMFHMSIGDPNAAGHDFLAIAENAPTSGSAAWQLGKWLVLHREYARAGTVLSQAVALGGDPGCSREWLARADHLRGLDTQALQLGGQVLAIGPEPADALALRIRIEISRGDREAALRDLQRIQQIRNADEVDPITLVSAYIATGRRDDALHVLRRYAAAHLFDLDQLGRLRSDPDLDSLRADPEFRAAIFDA